MGRVIISPSSSSQDCHKHCPLEKYPHKEYYLLDYWLPAVRHEQDEITIYQTIRKKKEVR